MRSGNYRAMGLGGERADGVGMDLSKRRSTMHRNESSAAVFAESGLTRTEHSRLRSTYCIIGEPCPVQPRTFTDNRNPHSVHRAYLGSLPQYLRAIEAAGSRDAEREVVERACMHLDEMKAVLRARVATVELPFPDARREAQSKDSREDEAQEKYSVDPTPTNAQYWHDTIAETHAADGPLMTWLRSKFEHIGRGPQRVA